MGSSSNGRLIPFTGAGAVEGGFASGVCVLTKVFANGDELAIPSLALLVLFAAGVKNVEAFALDGFTPFA